MRYELLGRLRISDGDSDYSFVGTHKSEIVLAALLIRADWVVKPDELITEIWGERQPMRAIEGLHVYISKLRKQLHKLKAGYDPIETRFPGYVLRKGDDEFDVDIFMDRIDKGRAYIAARRLDEATDSFEEALKLWRGPVLGDLHNGPIVNGFATWMTESRLECLEALIDAQLQMGRHRELVGRLYSLLAEHPLRESFYQYLMIALYRSNRQADALSVFQNAWRVLDEELGLAPCRALQDLQQAILAADDSQLLCGAP